MPWPSGGIDNSALDSTTDSPSDALAALKAAVDQLNAVIAMRGAAGGIPSLDLSGFIPAAQIGASGFQTGMGVDWWGQSAPTGWVFADGRTIGSAASTATARANDDTQALFTFLWNNHSNTVCPVSGGRGASAAADWSANKTITLIDKRGRVSVGKDNMGGTAANRVTTAGSGVDGSSLAATGGAETHTLTVAQIPAHSHNLRYTTVLPNNGILNGVNSAGSGTAIPGTDGGGGQAHNNVQPSIVCNYILKL